MAKLRWGGGFPIRAQPLPILPPIMSRVFGSFCCDYYGKFGGISSAMMLVVHTYSKNPLASKILAGREGRNQDKKKAEDF